MAIDTRYVTTRDDRILFVVRRDARTIGTIMKYRENFDTATNPWLACKGNGPAAVCVGTAYDRDAAIALVASA